MAEVPAAAWDAMVGDHEPFARHAFLHALETSGSVGAGTGWRPCHLLVVDGELPVAAMPLYEKHDSFGEFVFDWSWAEASERAGLAYYPKLVCAIPFTPATGARVLVAPGADASAVTSRVARALAERAAAGAYSGVHVLFCGQREQAAWQRQGYAARDGFQFHWQRDGAWRSFDDFLASLRSPSRKQIRKERARAAGHGLRLSMRAGASLGAEDCRALYALYRQTVWEKGAQSYLTAEFFQALRGPLASLVQVAVAQSERGIEAMALFFCAGEHLYGRYWGARVPLDSLHFELCYYLPIEWAIAHGVSRFEAGAQGEHKLKRGLLPSRCYSAHRLCHAGLHAAVEQFVERERAAVDATMEAYAAQGPYVRG
jgi:hypothetical protein